MSIATSPGSGHPDTGAFYRFKVDPELARDDTVGKTLGIVLMNHEIFPLSYSVLAL